MSPAATETPTSDRVIDSVLERQASIFDAIRSGNDRSHRFSRSLIESARQGTRDLVEINRRFLANPTDLVSVYEAASEAVADSQARLLALTREWIEDAAESQREGREVLRQGLGDVREAVERARANAPEILRRTPWARPGNGKAKAETNRAK
jgi:hypothetical protein